MTEKKQVGTMRFSELVGMLMREWPDEISLEDAQPPTESGGQYFPTFSKVAAAIEERIDYANDHWENLCQWSISQALHEEAKRNYNEGKPVLLTRSVSLERVNFYVLRNLQSEGFEDELALYEPYPS
jgi:hypothetical protein